MPEVTETQRVLAGQLVENTGRHMLDSGDYYGRSWERNQGKTVQDWLAEPDATIESEWVSLSLFHFLAERLEYSPAMQRLFDVWQAAHPDKADDPWLVTMEEFAEYASGRPLRNRDTFNSYNEENLLSQDVQGVIFRWRPNGKGPHADEVYLLLQVHGGCDARGGYTAPKLFRLDEEYDLSDWDSYSLYCDYTEPEQEPLPGMPEKSRDPHAVDYSHGELIEWGGSSTTVDDLWADGEMFIKDETGQPAIACPYCAKLGRVSWMSVAAPVVS